jgi:hypothetical protein
MKPVRPGIANAPHKLLCGTILLIFVIFLVALRQDAQADAGLYSVPLTFTGYITKDRWNQSIVYNGTQEYFLSDDAMKQVVGKENIPVTVEASVYRDAKTDTGLITSIQNLSKVKPAAFNFSLKLTSNTAKQGTGLPVHIQLFNGSDTKLTLDPYSLSVVVVAQDISQYAGTDSANVGGGSHWSVLNNFSSGGPGGGELQAYCSIAPVTWNPVRYFEASDGVSIGTATANRTGSGTYRPLIILPKNTVMIDDTVGHWLKPGKYEIFLQYNFADGFSPDTRRVAFDVNP